MSQYASAMNSSPGCVHFTRPISAGQNSSAGAATSHVRANTSLVISIAMSQRSPSHCAPTSTSVSATALRSPARERVELHDVRPRREVRVAAARDDPARRAHEVAGPLRQLLLRPGMKYSGCDASHGWSGATWFGT